MKTVLTVVLTAALTLGSSVYFTHRGLSPKHTGPAQVVLISGGGQHFWLMRPNKEVFEMYFDNPPALPTGIQLEDVVYTDDSKDQRHFVSVRLK